MTADALVAQVQRPGLIALSKPVQSLGWLRLLRLIDLGMHMLSSAIQHEMRSSTANMAGTAVLKDEGPSFTRAFVALQMHQTDDAHVKNADATCCRSKPKTALEKTSKVSLQLQTALQTCGMGKQL